MCKYTRKQKIVGRWNLHLRRDMGLCDGTCGIPSGASDVMCVDMLGSFFVVVVSHGTRPRTLCVVNHFVEVERAGVEILHAKYMYGSKNNDLGFNCVLVRVCVYAWSLSSFSRLIDGSPTLSMCRLLFSPSTYPLRTVLPHPPPRGRTRYSPLLDAPPPPHPPRTLSCASPPLPPSNKPRRIETTISCRPPWPVPEADKWRPATSSLPPPPPLPLARRRRRLLRRPPTARWCWRSSGCRSSRWRTCCSCGTSSTASASRWRRRGSLPAVDPLP